MTNRITKIIAASAFSLTLAAGAAVAQEAYSDWDTDGEAGISQNEFNTVIDGTGLYDSWDANDDGMLDESEFDAGLYGSYDDDGNGVIEEPEFGDLGDDMGDGGLFDV